MYDADEIDANIAASIPPNLWEDRIANIVDILISNSLNKSLFPVEFSAYSAFFRRPFLSNPQNQHPWLIPRPLSQGEISVLLKHHSALSMIGNGASPFGLIIEDDARLSPLTNILFAKTISEFINKNGDYLDLAGGCSLLPTDHDLRHNYATRLAVPRTRTNAAYIVSRKLAQRLSNRFFPLVFPIDWHLQYLFQKRDRCFWSNQPVFIHGSEHGLVQSWRS